MRPEPQQRVISGKGYELKDHLGNVRVVVKDVKEPVDPNTRTQFTTHYKEISDYYPFGMLMDGRNWQSHDERYGYNGMEQDDYLKENNQYLTTNPLFARTGTGNSYDYGARMYDSRVGRFMSRDPLEKKHPDKSSYSSFANNPILYIDKDGEDYSIYIDHNPEKPTITIKACYSVTGNDETSRTHLNQSIEFWNNQSGKYSYVVNNGSENIKYNINIELTEACDEDIEDNWFIENKGPINFFNGYNEAEFKSLKATDGTSGSSISTYIRYNITEFYKNNNIAKHEMGHNIILHSFTGLMRNPPLDDRVWPEYFSNILGQAGIGDMKELKGGKGKDNSEYMGRPIGFDLLITNYGFFYSGETPDNFFEGEINENENE